MNRTAIVPQDLHRPVSPYSHAIKAGNLVFTAGQIAIDIHGNLVGKGDCTAQAEQAYRNLQSVLAAAGSGLGQVIKLNTYVTSVYDVPKARDVKKRVFANIKEPPASTTVVVSALAYPDLLIEIEAVAVAD